MSSSLARQQTEALYLFHHDWLVRWLYRRLGCLDTAADLSHDTFLRLLHRPRQIDDAGKGDTKVRAYLGTIANGLCADYWRRQQIEQAWIETLAANPEAEEPAPEQRLMVVEALLQFDAMLRQLPARVADTFVMSQIEGLTYREIAAQLQVSERTVKSYMARAMLHCATILPSLQDV